LKSSFQIEKSISGAKFDIAGGSVIALLALYLLASGIKSQVSLGFGGSGAKIGIGPRTLPYFLALILLVLAVLMIIGALKRLKAGISRTVGISVMPFIAFAIGLLFAVLTEGLGYIPVNLLSMLGVYFLFGGRKLWVGLAIAVPFTVLSTLFFVFYLKLPITMGFGL